jgi:hypothetical protein
MNSPRTPYRKWLNEDVAYIITDEERAQFKTLQTSDLLTLSLTWLLWKRSRCRSNRSGGYGSFLMSRSYHP